MSGQSQLIATDKYPPDLGVSSSPADIIYSYFS